MGNHDAWFAFVLPEPRPSWMTEGEDRHQRWVHERLDPALRPVVAGRPQAVGEELGSLRVAFAHDGLGGAGRCCAGVVRDPGPAALDALFASLLSAAVVFSGHDHTPRERIGRARYVNPGALGCHHRPVARFAVLSVDADGGYAVARHAVPYDEADLFAQFERREVPERAFIQEAFFGRGGGDR